MAAFNKRLAGQVKQARIDLGDRLRGYFLTGVVVAAPILITALLISSVVGWVDSWFQPLFPQTWRRIAVPGLGLAVAVTGLTLLGAITANVAGRWILRLWEAVLLRVPVIKSIYGPVKQVFETVIGPDALSFREVVLAPYPHAQSRVLAFVTAVAPAEVSAALGESDADPIVSVFVPTSPNLYAGFLLMLPRSSLIAVELSVDEAVRTIVSMGIANGRDQPERSSSIAASRSNI